MCQSESSPADDACSVCGQSRIADWMRKDGKLIQPGTLLRLDRFQPTVPEGAYVHTNNAQAFEHSLGLVIETIRLPRKVIVCALPASHTDTASSMIPQVGAIDAEKTENGFLLPVVPIDAPPPFTTDEPFFLCATDKNEEPINLEEKEQEFLKRLLATHCGLRFCHFAVCGNRQCGSVYRVAGGGERVQRLSDPSRYAEELQHATIDAQTSLTELKLKKANLKRKKPASERDNRAIAVASEAIKKLQTRIMDLKKKAGSSQLWCPYCGWEEGGKSSGL